MEYSVVTLKGHELVELGRLHLAMDKYRSSEATIDTKHVDGCSVSNLIYNP